MNPDMIDIVEVSEETFLDFIGKGVCTATLGEGYEEEDIAVTHYSYRDKYMGTMRVTEDGVVYYLEDLPEQGISVEEAYELVYGA